MPDLGRRSDEIGDLNDALRSMTDALWQRLNAIESFAADVAHELKNPLTSLRSAIEIAARLDLDPDRRAKLMAIVIDDINRLDRLITDISDASRLDAELMRGEVQAGRSAGAAALDWSRLTHVDRQPKAGVPSTSASPPGPPFAALGHDGRYGQVFRNVIDNALSFSPPGSRSWSSSAASSERAVRRHDRRPRARAFPRTISNRSSSASTRSGRPSISASIRDWAFRSAGRSSRPMAARSPRQQQGSRGPVLGARFTVRMPPADRGA